MLDLGEAAIESNGGGHSQAGLDPNKLLVVVGDGDEISAFFKELSTNQSLSLF